MNYLKTLVIGVLILAHQLGYTVQPYESFHNLPATPFYVQDAYIYYDLINSRQASVVIDVDSEDGAVARFVAQQAANLPSVSVVYAINSWADSGANKHVYQRFISNVNQENTAHLITPIKMNSLDAALALKVTADFISLVGKNDSEGIYKDILAWFPHLSNIGVMCGNNWYDSAIQAGVTRAAHALDLTLHINSNVWYLDKNTP